MTRKIHKRSKVSRTESTNEPRQPSRLEKKRNTHAGCPTCHGPTRGVSGVSGSTTLFQMLAQTRLELLAAVHDRRNRDQRGSRRCAVARSAAMELVVCGREQSRVRQRGPDTARRSCHQRAHDRENPLTFRSRHAGRIWPSCPNLHHQGTGRHRANSASAATSLTPAINASSICRAKIPRISDTTESSLIPVPSSSFWIRWVSRPVPRSAIAAPHASARGARRRW